MEEYVHSIYINIAEDITDYLSGIYKRVTERFIELRDFEWAYHLNIVSKILVPSESESFFSQLHKEFSQDIAWSLSFDNFRATERGYIFFEPDIRSKSMMLQLHERAIRATQGLGYLGYTPGKEINFAFDPHLSLIKLRSFQAPEAMKLIQQPSLPLTMTVSAYMLGKQEVTETGISRIREVGRISLIR